MSIAILSQRSIFHYWRTNLAVLFGVAIAVAVLTGALLVGDSVRGSLRDLFLQRLGKTDEVVSSADFFREQLAADLQRDSRFSNDGFVAACPLIALNGNISQQATGRRAGEVRVYGIDNRFWRLHGISREAPQNREMLLSESLASELQSKPGDPILLRIEKPSAVPVESLHGRKEDLGKTLRLTMRAAIDAAQLGEFSVQPQQSAVRAVFVSLKLLQHELSRESKVNTILISSTSAAGSGRKQIEAILRDNVQLEDYGLKLRTLEQQKVVTLEPASTLLNDVIANRAYEAAKDLQLHIDPVFSYLANGISSGDRSIPYSLVTAIGVQKDGEPGRTSKPAASGRTSRPNDESANGTAQPTQKISPPPRPPVAPSSTSQFSDSVPPIILNEWAARDLGVKVGDPIKLEYYVWTDNGQLDQRTADFRLASITPMTGIAADRDLVPDYPGISESPSLSEWDPPFPVDLKNIRKQDEDYWHQYKTTPKAFIPLDKGQELWHSRFGSLTSIRLSNNNSAPLEQTLTQFRDALQTRLSPAASGFVVFDARSQGLQAARGATDFGEYFLYFSFFLVVAALMLAGLFFKLGIEQRLREIGTLQAIGFGANEIQRLFITEGLILSTCGSVLGLFGAIAYGYAILFGLRTWWLDAVGTKLLTLHISAVSLLIGGIGGVIAALLCIVWTLRGLRKLSTRSLLSGELSALSIATRGKTAGKRPGIVARLPRQPLLATGLLLGAVSLLLAAKSHVIGQVGGFFGGGALLLLALLVFQRSWLTRALWSRKADSSLTVSLLGLRNVKHRPARSVLCIALIAFATFIIVSVDAFRRNDRDAVTDRKSGSGGFPLLAESLLPLIHDPNTAAGREALNLFGDAKVTSLSNVKLTRFRLRPGDDSSCLNLYQPRNPRILGATDEFIKSNRFTFAGSVGHGANEIENPWLLLEQQLTDAVPVIADANSLTYVLHLKPGDDLVINAKDGPVRLRLVGSLSDSIFQSDLLMSEKNFLRLFPEQQGFRFFLIDVPADDVSAVTAALEDRLSDFGFDVVSTGERLASFHRVENTYLSTFQMLGGLGLVLGTLGLAAVLLRNVFERRKELALLRAVGYNSSHLALMVIAENAWLLVSGLVTGAFCAFVAIAPAFFSRGGRLPHLSLGLLLIAVLLSGLTASLVATLATLRSPLLPALRAE